MRKSLIRNRSCRRRLYVPESATPCALNRWAFPRSGLIRKHINFPNRTTRRSWNTLKSCITYPISTRRAGWRVRNLHYVLSISTRSGYRPGLPLTGTSGANPVRTSGTLWNYEARTRISVTLWRLPCPPNSGIPSLTRNPGNGITI